MSKILTKGQNVVVINSTHGNEIGKATVIYPDYKGFSNKKGAIVCFLETGQYGFVSIKDILPIQKMVWKNAKPKEPVPVLVPGHARLIDPGTREQIWRTFNDTAFPAIFNGFETLPGAIELPETNEVDWGEEHTL